MMGDGRGLVENLNNLGLCYMLLGRLEEAHETLMQSLTMRRSMDNPRGIASTLNALADVQIQRELARGYTLNPETSSVEQEIPLQHLPAALRYAGEALRIWLFHQDKWNSANSYASLAIIQLWLRERYSARDHLLEALRLASEIKAPFILLKALIGWARLLVLDGQPEQAAILLGLVENHSGLTAQLKHTHFNVLAASLSLENYPDEYALGRTNDLYQVVQQILSEADIEDGI
jgi:tetratricopeptide (TPR) repeat protein